MVEKVIKKCVFLAVPLVFLAGCWGGAKNEQKTTNSQPDERKLLVVNVLDKALYDDAHIASSINVPLAELQATSQKWNKDTAIVIYCSNYTCSASSGGARMLKKLGFNNVSAYEGGMAEWYQLSREDNSYAVQGAAKQDYLGVKVPKPSESHSDVKIITAQELRDQLRMK
jgi:rhodanese-related sulfurtransferase